MKSVRMVVPTYLGNVRSSSDATTEREAATLCDAPCVAGNAEPTMVSADEAAPKAMMEPNSKWDDPPDYGPPYVLVVICETDGVRVVLGSDDCEDLKKPDILVERRPNGWAIFLHPIGGGDPSGYVYFLDDGRSLLLQEGGAGGFGMIEVLVDRHLWIDGMRRNVVC
jgi:hypothetical protein